MRDTENGLIFALVRGIFELDWRGEGMSKLKFQKVLLNVAFYKEGNKFIAYSSALNLSTCGDSMSQAKKRFDEMVRIFIEEVDKMGTLEDVLLECGWKKTGHTQKQWQPPIFVGQDQEELKIPCPV